MVQERHARIREEIVWECSDDEVRAFRPEDGEFLTLNETGSFIWNQIAATSDVWAAVEQVVEKYGSGQRSSETEAIRQSSLNFLNTLRDGGYLVFDGVESA